MENTGCSSLPISSARSRLDQMTLEISRRGTELLLAPHGCPGDGMIEKLLDGTKETPSRSSHPRKTVDANQELKEDIQVVMWDKSKKISYNAELSPVTPIQCCMLSRCVNLCCKWCQPGSLLHEPEYSILVFLYLRVTTVYWFP